MKKEKNCKQKDREDIKNTKKRIKQKIRENKKCKREKKNLNKGIGKNKIKKGKCRQKQEKMKSFFLDPSWIFRVGLSVCLPFF